MFVLIILAVVVAIAIDVIISKKMESVAALKGYGKEVHAFVMCFLFGIVGYIYVAALPDKIQQEQNQRIIELLKQNHEDM